MTRTYPALALAALLVACGGGERASRSDTSNLQAASGCATADSSAAAIAVANYIASAEPRPQRFLSAPGTDSALTEDVMKVLQDKGPTFFWAGSDAAKQKLKEKLDFDPYVNMLVVVKDRQQAGDGMTESLTVAGHFIGAAQHGTSAQAKSYSFRCDNGRWVAADQPATASQ